MFNIPQAVAATGVAGGLAVMAAGAASSSATPLTPSPEVPASAARHGFTLAVTTATKSGGLELRLPGLERLGWSSPHLPVEQGRFELLATHPQARQQPTTRGRRIGALIAWKGRLYTGYGDYGANTGPIAISPYDPATGRFTKVWTADTEAIENYRLIRGKMYAPATDRRQRADYSVGEPWQDRGPLTTAHAFDMVTLDGDDLWLIGSKGPNAYAWRSLDNGASWQTSLKEPPVSGAEGDFARFYFGGVYHGRLYVQGVDYHHGGPHPRSRVFDGRAWSPGPNLLLERGMGWRPVTFADHLVYQSWEQGGWLLTFDGTVVRQALGWQAFDLKVVGDELYVLAGGFSSAGRQPGSRILRTPDLLQWSALQAPAPEGARSLAVLDGVLYLAGTEAQMFQHLGSPEWTPATVTWNAVPDIRIAVPAEGTELVAPAGMPVLVQAEDPDGQITEVEVAVDGSPVFVDRAPPFLGPVEGLGVGVHRITARAIDSAGTGRRYATTVNVGRGNNATPELEQGPTLTPLTPRAGEPVTLTVSASDADGDALMLLWDLGDGQLGGGTPVVHTYARPGDYQVQVLIFDGRGGLVTAQKAIQVQAPPVATPTPTPTVAPTPAQAPWGWVYMPLALRRTEGRGP